MTIVVTATEPTMAFEKAQQLISLATWVAARRTGVLISEVIERHGVSKRTAQRMLHTLELEFPETETHFDEDGRKRWRLDTGALRDLLTLTPDELAALDLAVDALDRNGQGPEAEQLRSLREKIVALVPRNRLARLETDHEALLVAQGLAARPGPVSRLDQKVAANIATALKASERVRIRYRSRGAVEASDRIVEPYGVLIGIRRYLVARPANDPAGPLRHYLAERIEAAELTGEMFERDPQFDIERHSRRAFGAFQNDSELADVIWKFAPEAALQARSFLFHPDQALEEQPDGSLVVRFRASGQLEMCWHLYMWGDKVEVIAPETLRQMVHSYRRNDFASLP